MRKLSGICSLLACLGVCLLTMQPVLAGARFSSSQEAATQQQHTAAPSDFVGSDVCTTCHSEIAKKFDINPHSRLALEHGGTGATCESCHGPGKAHVESGGEATKTFQFGKASAREVAATCLQCHNGVHPDFARSAHGKAGVTCTNCHSIHNFADEPALLKVAQPKLCYGCHTDIKPLFSQPFHHRVDEGLMTCSDCHDPHGTFQQKQLRTTADQNAICTKCHMEKAGPFAFEHPVVKTEGCVICHSPHGSPNPRLLNVANLNTLCLQCHSALNPTSFPHAISPSGPVHNQGAQYVACTNCHTQIHGSNSSNVFFR